jgi:hypothetical protein
MAYADEADVAVAVRVCGYDIYMRLRAHRRGQAVQRAPTNNG